MKTDYIDLYQSQWPNPTVPIDETMYALDKLLKQGKLDLLVFGNFDVEQIIEANRSFGKNIVSVQTEYNIWNRIIEKSLIPYCDKEKISIIGYSPLGQGNRFFSKKGKECLVRLSNKYGVTITQIILNWIISHSSLVALTMSMNLEHVKQNILAADFELSGEDITLINKVFEKKTVLVETCKITILDSDIDQTHDIYTSLEEALLNKKNIQPSSEIIAEEIKNKGLLKPVELICLKKNTNDVKYKLVHGRMRYWAWIIAYGENEPIPAYIMENEEI